MPKNGKKPVYQSVWEFADAHDPDSDHAEQVCARSLELFDLLKELHGLGARERSLLEATAILHDVGYDCNPKSHQKGSRKLILDTQLEGFSRKEIEIMACVARYHGKREPKPTDKVYRDLDPNDQSVANKLAAILRITDGLDRCHENSAEALRIEKTGKTIHLYVRQDTPNPIDIDGALRKSEFFEKVFGVKPAIIGE